MPVDLYYMPLSGPCRSVMMTAKLVNVDLNLKLTNLMAGEHLTPEFLAMNPQHTIPTLDDNGFYLNESRAICAYLAQQYGKDDSLYPKDAKKRAIVDQRLYFDMGTLYQRFAEYYYPVLWQSATTLDESKETRFEESLQWLEGYLSKSSYAAGDHLTIADLALLATITTIEATNHEHLSNTPHIKQWLARCKEQIPNHQELNQEGADAFGQIAKGALAKLKA